MVSLCAACMQLANWDSLMPNERMPQRITREGEPNESLCCDRFRFLFAWHDPVQGRCSGSTIFTVSCAVARCSLLVRVCATENKRNRTNNNLSRTHLNFGLCKMSRVSYNVNYLRMKSERCTLFPYRPLSNEDN